MHLTFYGFLWASPNANKLHQERTLHFTGDQHTEVWRKSNFCKLLGILRATGLISEAHCMLFILYYTFCLRVAINQEDTVWASQRGTVTRICSRKRSVTFSQRPGSLHKLNSSSFTCVHCWFLWLITVYIWSLGPELHWASMICDRRFSYSDDWNLISVLVNFWSHKRYQKITVLNNSGWRRWFWKNNPEMVIFKSGRRNWRGGWSENSIAKKT